MTEPDQTSEHLTQYLRQLTPRARARLLAELERLLLLGEDIPHSKPLIAALRAELHDTGESHSRIGNRLRYFYEPLEPVLVDAPPERANSGQIACGSLAPIWNLVAEQLLPSMAREYMATAQKVMVVNCQAEARRIAAAFQKKVVIYLNQILETDDGLTAVRTGLEAYTSSRATFNDLIKMIRVMHARQELAEFARALPLKIADLEGRSLAKVFDLLNVLHAKRVEAVPFALTIIARRLETPWQLVHLATKLAASRAAPEIAATPYAVAVPMVLDQMDEQHLMITYAFTHNRIARAKEILTEIYGIEEAVRGRIELDGSDWGKRLHIDGGGGDRGRCRNQQHSHRPPASHAHPRIRQAAPRPFLGRTSGSHDQKGPRHIAEACCRTALA
ncbi:hypothetical protein [Bradyrhizobium sp. Arg816]|uniref:hypothetical protein n=1 Tax=Bradyrhizobium sp. Arg816 TaxID=2998491 RepID=UPI00249E6623|nr:hypothetical protein [Bradyrhizobium sp. Arg816]MDI3567488.1 hypothetical protein [Bradyrhizobium sp. Arg816]